MLPLLFAPLASAQRGEAPSFVLQAPSSCTGAQSGYTCTGSAQVIDYSPTSCGTGCHLEYCFAKTVTDNHANCNNWFETLPDTISLGNNLSDGPITIYSEYKPVTNGVDGQPSYYYGAQITLINTAPAVGVNSPTGIKPALGLCTSFAQTQLINGSVGQYVTYGAASTGGGTVSVSLEPCIWNSSCGSSVNLPQTQFIDPPAPATYTLPSVWGWIDPGTDSYSYGYVQLTAQDEAGNTASTPPLCSAPFTLFDGDTTTENIACSPVTCTYLADGTGESSGAGDMPGDPPSQPDALGNVFAGYADPTMRADTLVTPNNPDGLNLWMGYSWPLIQTYSGGTGAGTTVGTVESHLVQSSTVNGLNGGASWTAWCSGGDTCSGYTAIYSSSEHGNGVTDPYHFSSHEVLNLWPYIVQPGPANGYVGTETWYAAHLVYYRYYSDQLPFDIQRFGCLVVATSNTSQNTQDSPGDLAWSTEPDACTGTAPSNSVFLDWSYLNSKSGQSCKSWGQPTIMVSSDGGTVYLAASCFDESFASTGYWIFTVPTSQMLTKSSWTLFNETFSFSDLPSTLQTTLGNLGYSYLTEFDWARRADGTLVAVVTPAGTGTPRQYGCLAMTFYLSSGTATPFGPIADTIADTITDSDTSGPNVTSETNGPNGCTYDPLSNNGVVIVRYLVNSSSSIQTYSLVNTGLLP